MKETFKATQETAQEPDELLADSRKPEGTRCKELVEGPACRLDAPMPKPSLPQRLVAMFVLLATLGCAAWAILDERDFVTATVVLAGGLFLSARLGGVLGGG
jgi:hypothetical protein